MTEEKEIPNDYNIDDIIEKLFESFFDKGNVLDQRQIEDD